MEGANEKAQSMEENATLAMTPENFMLATGEILVAMGIGTIVSKFFTSIGLTFPGYIGSMIIAAIIRNVSDHTQGGLPVSHAGNRYGWGCRSEHLPEPGYDEPADLGTVRHC